jgi:hypothetical protein
MAFRQDYDNFQFSNKDRGIWYFVIDWKNKTRKEFSNMQGKRDIVPFLRTILSEQTQDNYELLGVWHVYIVLTFS